MSEDKPTIDHFELLLFDVSTNQWNVVDTKEDDNTPFSYFAYDKDGPDYRFKVVIVFLMDPEQASMRRRRKHIPIKMLEECMTRLLWVMSNQKEQ